MGSCALGPVTQLAGHTDHPIADDGGPAASWAGASLPGGQRLSLNPPMGNRLRLAGL